MKTNKGITLMVLIITIVIMLILATVTIGAINSGLFDFAGDAKKTAEDTNIMDGIGKAYLITKDLNKTVTEEDFQIQLNKILPNANITIVPNGNGFDILVDGDGYTVNEKGDTKSLGKVEPAQYPGDITKGGTCTGTQSKPYKIECIEDLVAFSKSVNTDTSTYSLYGGKYIQLTKDLDFNSIFSYSDYKAKYSYDSEQMAYIPDENSETTIKELLTNRDGQGFIPIGLGSDNGRKCFTGIFYGEEQREIKNIYIKKSGRAALFGICSCPYGSATIKNITIDGQITCTSGSTAAGFVANVNKEYNLNLINCINKANITNTGTGNAVGFTAGTSGGR